MSNSSFTFQGKFEPHPTCGIDGKGLEAPDTLGTSPPNTASHGLKLFAWPRNLTFLLSLDWVLGLPWDDFR